MAEKDTKPKTTAKPAATTAKPAANTAAAKPKATVTKPTAKPAAKPTATTAAKPTTAAKTATTAKPTTAAKPTATTASAKTAGSKTSGKATVIDAKPAGKTTTAATTKPAATSATKPTATSATKPAATTTAKPEQVSKPAAAAADTASKDAAKPAPATSEQKPKKVATTAATPEKQTKAKPAKENGGKAVAALSSKKVRIILMSAVAFVLILALIIGIVVGTKSCNTNKGPTLSDDPPDTSNDYVAVPTDKPVSKDTLILNHVDASDPAIADWIADQYKYEYAATTAVGFSAEILEENIERVKPVDEIKDERELFPLGIETAGSVRYPKYGSTMSSVVGSDPDGLKAAARTVLINESDYLTAYGTRNNSGNGNNKYDDFNATYNKIDADGYLWFVNNGTTTPAENPDHSQRRLYKHSAAEGMYLEGFGDIPMISDTQPSVTKQITVRPRGYSSYSITGLYAPAGEVIKVEMSGADMDASGGITIHIGQALYNGQSNNIWTAKGQMQRFPNILNTMVVNKSTATYDESRDVWTAYVGSFIGGPIYIRNTSKTVTATITGGLEYVHFVLGYTTEEEFNRIKNYTTVPYFDLEVWQYGVLHSGPLYYAKNFTYDELYKAAILWEKVSLVTTTNGTKQGIVFLYDPFVAAGAAVAFPGRSSVNCPAGWMTNSLNYNGIVTSGGWGNFHEYHHNFQNFGIGYTGEVTNNALNLVSYSLFTKISSHRGIASYGAAGLSGWNTYTSATWALQRVKDNQIAGTNGLAVYATLLHNFGQDAFIKARGVSGVKYFNRWADITHQNMSYFAKMSKTYAGVDYSSQLTPNDYNMFVPVSCVYQTGRGYMYDGAMRYSQTMRPYVIPADGEFLVDLSKYNAPDGQYSSGSIVIPDGFSYRVKSITQPAHGSIELVDNFNFKYTPAAGAKTGDTSGQIVVTLEIVKDDGAFKVDDVDLVLEFELSHETNKTTLERTTYTYTSDNMFTDAVEAFTANFGNYETVGTIDHSNPVQNANTDIWYYPDTEANREKYGDAPEHYFIHDNMIDVIDGKLHFSESGKYRVYLRGRLNAAVYFSIDGKYYELGARIKDTTAPSNSAAFRLNDSNTYFDIEMNDDGDVTVTTYTGGEQTYNYKMTGERWLYVKEILIMQSSPSVSYIGLGVGTWTEPQYTAHEKYYDADGNEVSSPEDENYHHSATVYYDNAGNVVPEEIVNAAEKTPPTSATYANAYRSDYELPTNTTFESEYFYTQAYNYNYVDNKILGSDEKNVKNAKNMGLNTSWGTDVNHLDVILDGIRDKGDKLQLHSSGAPSETRPFIFEIDLGEVCSANRFILYTQSRSDPQYPKNMNLYSSLDGENYTLIGNYTDLALSNGAVTINFDETEMRYYKIEMTKSSGGYIILRELEMWHINEIHGNGANLIAPTNEHLIFSKNWSSQIAPSTFGHVHVGHAGDKAVFEFKGTRLAILTSDAYGKNFDVYIDGVKVSSIDVAEHSGAYGITYLSEKLESGTHKVEIRCTGEANIDSIAIYNEA